MAKQAYVYSGTDWVPLASEVTNLSNYQLSNGVGLKKIIPTSVAVGSGTGSVDSLGTVTFSGASSVSLNGVFTTTYDNYLILIDKVGSGGLDVNLRLRAAGVDDSSANYQSQRLIADNTTVSATRTANATSSRFDNAQTARSVTRLLISSPKLTEVTLFESLVVVLGATATPSLVTFVGGLNTSTAYDSLTVFCSGTMTGTARVYGYN
jgi:hypothetical protein